MITYQKMILKPIYKNLREEVWIEYNKTFKKIFWKGLMIPVNIH